MGDPATTSSTRTGGAATRVETGRRAMQEDRIILAAVLAAVLPAASCIGRMAISTLLIGAKSYALFR